MSKFLWQLFWQSALLAALCGHSSCLPDDDCSMTATCPPQTDAGLEGNISRDAVGDLAMDSLDVDGPHDASLSTDDGAIPDAPADDGVVPREGSEGAEQEDAKNMPVVDCSNGTTRPCVGAQGNCGRGVQTCANGTWGNCSIAPAAADTCIAGDDATCNGTPNEGCPCLNGQTRACGPSRVGVCKPGVQSCEGGTWGAACIGSVNPKRRDCSSAEDNDCDGVPDNAIDAVCPCLVGTQRECDKHGEADQHPPCKPGLQTCVLGNEKTTSWGTCAGAVAPAVKDTCAAQNDSDCDGVANEGCSCVDGSTRACGMTVGVCQAGVQTCVGGTWSTACAGAVAPSSRNCTSSLDNNCDGVPDKNETACVCPSGATEACGTVSGPMPCKLGTRSCVLAPDSKSTAWSACTGAVVPALSDGCNLGNDATCNGVPNEGCPPDFPADGRLPVGNVLFATGTATIAEASLPSLEDVLTWLRNRPRVTRLRIEGHTDDVGRPADNMTLSLERAHAVKNWLIENGIAANRLIAVGFGGTRPLPTATNIADHRRVEFYVTELEGVSYGGADQTDGGTPVQ